MRITNLAGIFSGTGFAQRDGRKPDFEGCAFLPGPIDIAIDPATGRILGTEKPARAYDPREEIVDGTGHFASPGMIDTHTHAIFEGQRTKEFFLRWQGATYQEMAAAGGGIHNTVLATAQTSDGDVKHALAERLRTMGASGTTTVEIKSGYADHALGELRLLRLIDEVRREHASQAFPRSKSTFLGLHHLPKGKTESAYVDEMISVLAKIGEDKLADFVDAFPENGFFSVDESLRFCRAARDHGLHAKIHADELSDLGSAKAFSEFGSLSVDHLQKISDAGIAALAKSPTIATLMPATSFFLGLPYADARRLIEGGARVALATDYNPGTAPEPSLFFSIRLAAAQLKMSAEEILCATTYNAAHAIGEQGTLGVVHAGHRADLLLWPGDRRDPLGSLQGFFLGERRLRHVVIGGKIFRG